MAAHVALGIALWIALAAAYAAVARIVFKRWGTAATWALAAAVAALLVLVFWQRMAAAFGPARPAPLVVQLNTFVVPVVALAAATALLLRKLRADPAAGIGPVLGIGVVGFLAGALAVLLLAFVQDLLRLFASA